MRARFAAAFGLAAVLVAGCAGAQPAMQSGKAGSPTSPAALPSPAAQAGPWSPPPIPDIAGHDEYTVERAIAERDAGRLGDTTIALGGYWSVSGFAHGCAGPPHQPSPLELYCEKGDYGITDRYESTVIVIGSGDAISARITSDPYLTPFVPEALRQGLFAVKPSAIVPIVVLGHFDDAASSDCVASAQATCRATFVVESILAFDPAAAPTPTPSPTPTPFPSPPPPGLSAATACAGDVPYSFVGWTTTDALHSSLSFDGHVWAVVTRDVVPTGDWNELHRDPDHWNLPMGRRVCVWLEVDTYVTHYSVVIGTAYRQWDDGRRTKADDFGPGSGDPSLPADTSTPPLPAPVVVAMHGRGVVDARMAIYDWSGLLRSARPATAAELALPGSATGRGRTGVAVILPSDSRSLLLVWAECGSDTSGTISVTADRSTVILHAAPHYNCGQPGARRGAVLTFASPVPAAVQAVASLPDG